MRRTTWSRTRFARPPWPRPGGGADTPSGLSRAEDELFARAVDAGGPGGDFEAELAVVSALRGLTASLPVEGGARDRIAERIAAAPPRPAARPRAAPVLVAVVAMLLALGGLTLVLSRDALPGDLLYPLKRLNEHASTAASHLTALTTRSGGTRLPLPRHPHHRERHRPAVRSPLTAGADRGSSDRVDRPPGSL